VNNELERKQLWHNLTFEVETHLNNIYEFSMYLKENTTLPQNKDQLVDAVQGNNPSLL
jgi:hypothetical protein